MVACSCGIYCKYLASNEEQIAKQTASGGFEAYSMKQVSSVIDPTTAE